MLEKTPALKTTARSLPAEFLLLIHLLRLGFPHQALIQ
jgi:hypothetical protein